MFIADAHCDMLWKSAEGSVPVVNRDTLREGGVQLQNTALFVPPSLSNKRQYALLNEELRVLQTLTQDSTKQDSDFMLSLEGASLIGDDLKEWTRLKDAGLEMAGLTWNEKNQLAAGSEQPNQFGLTDEGKDIIEWMNDHKIILDAAHLNEQSFWQALEFAGRTAVSHTNVRALHDHPRNLTDKQISALIKQEGFIGLTFYPYFINGTEEADFSDFGRQVEHLCSLGAASITGFGSDFDGISKTMNGMISPAGFPDLVEWLLQRFDEDTVKGIAGANFLRFRQRA
ncbi:dipeptidase [Salibacterium halotolerans]|uniref:Membrane dipeptidase n=1 Tax=Salibacterium halotolerans TaxID=1884432 RepID=A0A1I5USN6_9BACI|nr:membrane dipeptidase [Salibacterium halotolerans]SFP98273.1 membrane dipeptidase [Salibacterium halotolerans]